MPHKRNPILSENTTGLSRLLRAYAQAALEDVALWHERDISHSSVERVIAPDATSVLDFMLRRLTAVVDGLLVYPQRMKENVALTRGLVFSQSVLLRLAEKGMPRQAAYERVQAAAMRVWDEGIDFRRALDEDKVIAERLTAPELDSCFDVAHELRHVDALFGRAFGDDA